MIADTQAGAPNAAIATRLATMLTSIQALDNKTVLGVNVIREAMIIGALHQLATALLPNKILQFNKRHLRATRCGCNDSPHAHRTHQHRRNSTFATQL